MVCSLIAVIVLAMCRCSDTHVKMRSKDMVLCRSVSLTG
jgi:hypothetical protein